MANVLDARISGAGTADCFAFSADEGEVWLGARGARINVRGGAVVGLRLLDGAPLFKGDAEPSPALRRAMEQVAQYLQGLRKSFDLEVFMDGPPFYRAVWLALKELPYGRTVTYGQLAELAGRPGSARAVGSAMRLNPLALIVPCHRVVGSQGKLGGFSFGTLWKKHLLELEQRQSGMEFMA